MSRPPWSHSHLALLSLGSFALGGNPGGPDEGWSVPSTVNSGDGILDSGHMCFSYSKPGLQNEAHRVPLTLMARIMAAGTSQHAAQEHMHGGMHVHLMGGNMGLSEAIWISEAGQVRHRREGGGYSDLR